MDKDLIAVFREDGSVKIGWDLTLDQLRELRDIYIPKLINHTMEKDPKIFTTFNRVPAGVDAK